MIKNNNLNYTNDNYVLTKYTTNLTNRAILYLNNGFPVHLKGSAGVGKTSLAFHIAETIGKPVLFICGSEEINDENLIGGYVGTKKFILEDNFISTVYKKREIAEKAWNDGRLLTACKEGYTVIYDEFTRTPPEINNVLLSMLEEKIVDIPYIYYSEYLNIHPDFKMIFTSNPDEYTGVYKSPNALLDRMITIDMNSLDKETEKQVIIAKAGISSEEAQKIMELSGYIKKESGSNTYSSIRSSIMLAKIIKAAKIKMSSESSVFQSICRDIYNSVNISSGLSDEKSSNLDAIINNAIKTVFTNETKV